MKTYEEVYNYALSLIKATTPDISDKESRMIADFAFHLAHCWASAVSSLEENIVNVLDKPLEQILAENSIERISLEESN